MITKPDNVHHCRVVASKYSEFSSRPIVPEPYLSVFVCGSELAVRANRDPEHLTSVSAERESVGSWRCSPDSGPTCFKVAVWRDTGKSIAVGTHRSTHLPWQGQQ